MSEEIKKSDELTEKQENIKAKAEELKEKAKEVGEVLQANRGRLELSKPIQAGEEEITELAFDFNLITGLDVANAMDADTSSSTIYRVSYRQSFALFAAAAAKCTPNLDARDIQERMGSADVFTAVQLAVRFFNSSIQAGQRHLSKK